MVKHKTKKYFIYSARIWNYLRNQIRTVTINPNERLFVENKLDINVALHVNAFTFKSNNMFFPRC